VVLSRALLHAAGAYRVSHATLRGRAVATNTPPNGAFRGFGAPQSIFAIERHIDRIARVLDLDPVEVRRRNLLRTGDTLPFGQILRDPAGASLVLERALELSGYERKRRDGRGRRQTGASASSEAKGGNGQEQAGPDNARQPDSRRSGGAPQDPVEPGVAAPGPDLLPGIGVSLYLHGGGFTGSGEEKMAARVKVRFDPAGFLEILVSSTDMGQGASTTLSQIAAEALGLPLDRVRHPAPDTSRVPDSGPTVASRTIMIVGRIVVDACRDLLARVSRALARRHNVPEESVTERDGNLLVPGSPPQALLEAARWYTREIGPLEGEASFVPTPGVPWDEEAYRGDAYKAYSWGADVIEVEVDPATLQVRPLRATVVVEIGRAINPVVAAGQVEGGTLQGIGYGSMEEILLEGGRYLNDRMATYIIPTALDTPDFRVEIAEAPYPHGPFGAKGLGELPADGAAPALAAAIADATGLFPEEIPITPEKLLRMQEEALSGQAEERSDDPGGESGA